MRCVISADKDTTRHVKLDNVHRGRMKASRHWTRDRQGGTGIRHRRDGESDHRHQRGRPWCWTRQAHDMRRGGKHRSSCTPWNRCQHERILQREFGIIRLGQASEQETVGIDCWDVIGYDVKGNVYRQQTDSKNGIDASKVVQDWEVDGVESKDQSRLTTPKKTLAVHLSWYPSGEASVLIVDRWLRS